MVITISKKFVAEDEDGMRAGFGDTEMQALENLINGTSLNMAKEISTPEERLKLPFELSVVEPHTHWPTKRDDEPRPMGLKDEILELIKGNQGIHSSKIKEKFPGPKCGFALKQLRNAGLVTAQALGTSNRQGLNYFTREHCKAIADNNRAASIEPVKAKPKLNTLDWAQRLRDEWAAVSFHMKEELDKDGAFSYDWDKDRQDWFEDYNDFKEFALALAHHEVPESVVGYEYSATVGSGGSILTVTAKGPPQDAKG